MICHMALEKTNSVEIHPPPLQNGVAMKARYPCRVRCAYLSESKWYAQRTLRFGFHRRGYQRVDKIVGGCLKPSWSGLGRAIELQERGKSWLAHRDWH